MRYPWLLFEDSWRTPSTSSYNCYSPPSITAFLTSAVLHINFTVSYQHVSKPYNLSWFFTNSTHSHESWRYRRITSLTSFFRLQYARSSHTLCALQPKDRHHGCRCRSGYREDVTSQTTGSAEGREARHWAWNGVSWLGTSLWPLKELFLLHLFFPLTAS